MDDPRPDASTDHDEDEEQLDPLEGLLDPGDGSSTPASDADAPAPPG